MRGTTIGIGLAALLLPVACLAAGPEHGGVSDYQFWDFVWRVMNFVVMAAVLVVLLKKPVSLGLKERSQAIAAELRDLEARRDEARRQYAELEEALGDAQAQREAILADCRAQGEREREKILAEARALAERIQAQAQFTIEREAKEAAAELRREVAELSAALAADLLRQQVTPGDQARLLDEYLAGLAATPH